MGAQNKKKRKKWETSLPQWKDRRESFLPASGYTQKVPCCLPFSCKCYHHLGSRPGRQAQRKHHTVPKLKDIQAKKEEEVERDRASQETLHGREPAARVGTGSKQQAGPVGQVGQGRTAERATTETKIPVTSHRQVCICSPKVYGRPRTRQDTLPLQRWLKAACGLRQYHLEHMASRSF